MNKTKMVPLNKIRDNPWRDRVRNPIDANRVEAIAVSIGKTKYWMGTYGREMPDGTVQLAFGHHRFEAAKEQGLKEIPIIIEDFTDGEMLVWMAQENVRGELPVVIEAVSAVVSALGENKVALESLDPSTNKSIVRYAPSFIPGKAPGPTEGPRPYTVDSVARFLGYIKRSTNKARDSVVAAVGILEQAEKAKIEVDEKKAASVERSFSKMSVRDATKALSEVKRRELFDTAKQGERSKEVAKYNAKQLALQEEIKARAAKEKAAHDELIRKQTAAKLEEDTKAIKLLAQKIREQTAAAKLKALADVDSMKAIEAKLKAAKEKAVAAFKEDAYAPVRRDVERLLFKMNSVSTGSFCEDIKSISKLPLTVKDRQRVWEAAQALGEWYLGWVSAQVSTTVLSGKKELKEMKSREVANRRKAEAAAQAIEEVARKERVAAKAVAAKAAKAAKETK